MLLDYLGGNVTVATSANASGSNMSLGVMTYSSSFPGAGLRPVARDSLGPDTPAVFQMVLMVTRRLGADGDANAALRERGAMGVDGERVVGAAR